MSARDQMQECIDRAVTLAGLGKYTLAASELYEAGDHARSAKAESRMNAAPTPGQIGQALNAAIVQYDLSCRLERDDEDYWLEQIVELRDALSAQVSA